MKERLNVGQTANETVPSPTEPLAEDAIDVSTSKELQSRTASLHFTIDVTERHDLTLNKKGGSAQKTAIRYQKQEEADGTGTQKPQQQQALHVPSLNVSATPKCTISSPSAPQYPKMSGPCRRCLFAARHPKLQAHVVSTTKMFPLCHRMMPRGSYTATHKPLLPRCATVLRPPRIVLKHYH